MTGGNETRPDMAQWDCNDCGDAALEDARHSLLRLIALVMIADIIGGAALAAIITWMIVS